MGRKRKRKGLDAVQALSTTTKTQFLDSWGTNDSTCSCLLLSLCHILSCLSWKLRLRLLLQHLFHWETVALTNAGFLSRGKISCSLDRKDLSPHQQKYKFSWDASKGYMPNYTDFLHGDLIFGLQLGSPDFACSSLGESSNLYPGSSRITKHLLPAAHWWDAINMGLKRTAPIMPNLNSCTQWLL